MFLSIVIPVYNGGDTIRRCLDSIWTQNLPDDDFEVICVDDCSKDNTLEILEEEKSKHPQLRVLKNGENLRAGGARNLGVRNARGEYIVFIDADDYFHQGSLKLAYDYQKEKKLDILVCDFARHPEGKPNNELVHNFKSDKIMSGREFMLVNSLPYAPWKYIFKKDLMLKNKVFFEKKVSCEDVDWTHKLAFYAKTMQYQPLLLTHYILMPNSQTGGEYKNKHLVFNRLKCGKRISDLIDLYKEEKEREHILRVAEETLKNGLIFLNGVFSNPTEKEKILCENINPEIEWKNKLVSLVCNHPKLYSYTSTLLSPFFRSLIIIKRNFFGR